MRILVVGSGGREHALAWKLAQSDAVTALLVAPGNGGTSQERGRFGAVRNVAVAADDVSGLVALARAEAIDLVVPGSEAALVLGLADACDAAGIACFGPSRAAARLEGSKAFMKEIAAEAGIATARARVFEDAERAAAHLAAGPAPVVVKADGLAAGKGVVVAATHDEAIGAARAMLQAPGSRIVIEECLEGPELSLFALCDGRVAVPFGAARDHKRAFDGDQGPNTGGMGAYSPVEGWDEAALGPLVDRFVRPVLQAMERRGTPFRGVLFAGLMLTPDGPRLLEFNVRFGDPECQALLLRFEGDLARLLLAGAQGRLGGASAPFSQRSAVVVVRVAQRYPEGGSQGERIGGLAEAASVQDALIFHAGTRIDGDQVLATGGRVLNLCGVGATLLEARKTAYSANARVVWPGGRARTDIAHGMVALPVPGT